MKLPIYVYGEPVLRQVAEDITPEYPELKQLIANMYETLENAEGVGLAAPQIGLPIRLVVIDLRDLADDYPEYKDFRKTYINALSEMKGKVDAIAITGYLSIRNPEHEERLAHLADEILGVPVVQGHELSSGLGFNERTSLTALSLLDA